MSGRPPPRGKTPAPPLPSQSIEIAPGIVSSAGILRNSYVGPAHFLDHFSDFDPIKEWLIVPDHNPMYDSDILRDSDGFELRNIVLGHQDPILEATSIDEKMEKVSLVESKIDPDEDEGNTKNVEVLEVNMEAGDGASNGLVGEVKKDGVGEVKNDVDNEVCFISDPIKMANESDDEESSKETEEESEDSSSESPSSSSSSEEEEESSSSDEEEEDEGEVAAAAVEVEEGEINGDDLEVMLASDGEENVLKGPIKSKHEIEDLPPVPPLEVSLEPHHQTLPVGSILSILGSRVVVEGSEKHSPLKEGSILWITETRSPLGIIDEIFGPVKNPYYIVRYNSDKEVPPGISTGVAISFVADFADHILNEKSLYQKGYDASGADDEETMDEVEFSDDEKEAEYKRYLKQNKRDANHGNQESGFGKKKHNFQGAGFDRHKQLQSPHSLAIATMDQPLPRQNGQVHASPAAVNSGRNNCNHANGAANVGGTASSPMMVPAFPSQPQTFQMGISSAFGNTSQSFNNVSAQGFPPHPQPIVIQGGGFASQPCPLGIQGGFPTEAMPMGAQGGFPSQPQIMAMQGGGPPMHWLPAQQFGDQTCNLQHQNQGFNNFASGIMPYQQQQQQQQQLMPNVGGLPFNFPWFPGSSNSSLGPSALIGLMGHGGFGQVPFGFGNVNFQGTLPFSNEQSHGQASPLVIQGEMRPPSMQFNGGRPFSRGRRPYQRGGHRSFGRRGGSHQNG